MERATRLREFIVVAADEATRRPDRPWAYFCQISDSTDLVWLVLGRDTEREDHLDKLTPATPMFVIESDATIVAPLMLRALLECRQVPSDEPEEAPPADAKPSARPWRWGEVRSLLRAFAGDDRSGGRGSGRARSERQAHAVELADRGDAVGDGLWAHVDGLGSSVRHGDLPELRCRRGLGGARRGASWRRAPRARRRTAPALPRRPPGAISKRQ